MDEKKIKYIPLKIHCLEFHAKPKDKWARMSGKE